jgi:dicarboxylate transporter 10
MTSHIIKTNGFFSLYNGISAALLRQATYSTTRFAIYESSKKAVLKNSDDKNLPFWKSILIAGFSGSIGGFFGTPADLVNVRMQNDSKLPIEQRRNYKNCFDGLFRIIRQEGFKNIFSGTTMAVSRGAFVTIGQVCVYNTFKNRLN